MRYLDKQGSEITRDEYLTLFDDRAYLRVGATELESPKTRFIVSTTWPGMDDGGKGFVFETLISKDGRDKQVVKYRTLDEAKEGHNAAVGDCMMQLAEGPRLVRNIPAEET